MSILITLKNVLISLINWKNFRRCARFRAVHIKKTQVRSFYSKPQMTNTTLDANTQKNDGLFIKVRENNFGVRSKKTSMAMGTISIPVVLLCHFQQQKRPSKLKISTCTSENNK